jgi:hypothetical protein
VETAEAYPKPPLLTKPGFSLQLRLEADDEQRGFGVDGDGEDGGAAPSTVVRARGAPRHGPELPRGAGPDQEGMTSPRL